MEEMRVPFFAGLILLSGLLLLTPCTPADVVRTPTAQSHGNYYMQSLLLANTVDVIE